MTAVLTLAKISSDVYNDASGQPIAGYKRVEAMAFPAWAGSSFYGAMYYQGSTGIVAFRGSWELQDWTDADASIASGSFPINQIGDAFDFFSKAKEFLVKIGVSRIVVTGHSLGGGLTQLIAARITTFPIVGVTFNAPGMAALTGVVRFEAKNSSNVFNYRSEHDPVSLSGRHIGKSPVVIKNAGVHPLGPLIEALESTAVASIKH